MPSAAIYRQKYDKKALHGVRFNARVRRDISISRGFSHFFRRGTGGMIRAETQENTTVVGVCRLLRKTVEPSIDT